jgi:DNA-binding transcriptional ArsR family regulator
MTKRHVPSDRTRATVEALAAYGIPEEHIAADIGVSPPTLRKHYRAELDTAATRANAKVGEFLFSMATGRNGPLARDKDGSVIRDANGVPIREADYRASTTAAIFWAKTRMLWREVSGVNLSVEDDSSGARELLTRAIDRLAPAGGEETATTAPEA